MCENKILRVKVNLCLLQNHVKKIIKSIRSGLHCFGIGYFVVVDNVYIASQPIKL